MTAPDPDDLAAVVEAATGRPLASLTATEALDVAEQVRAILAALPATNPRDAHLCALLTEAAELVERRAGIA
ncbi:MAG: hypothetical protein ACLPR9_20220 [Acidimicrobiales bacterium]